jgi:hypothetical protein
VTVLLAGKSGVRIPGRAQEILSIVHITQNDYGAHLPFCSMGTWRVKRLGRQVEQVLPSRAEVKNEWTYTSVPPVCFRGVDWFTLLLPSLLPC